MTLAGVFKTTAALCHPGEFFCYGDETMYQDPFVPVGICCLTKPLFAVCCDRKPC